MKKNHGRLGADSEIKERGVRRTTSSASTFLPKLSGLIESKQTMDNIGAENAIEVYPQNTRRLCMHPCTALQHTRAHRVGVKGNSRQTLSLCTYPR